ncbi:uncharacterized protein LOC143032224 [Oratosquilla oratoria]|uniref:uncharacterized protein LOC143032224 n=1 Tax=Oratosquilla oratoria TaxID=337810 RepID=UPI003F769698
MSVCICRSFHPFTPFAETTGPAQSWSTEKDSGSGRGNTVRTNDNGFRGESVDDAGQIIRSGTRGHADGRSFGTAGDGGDRNESDGDGVEENGYWKISRPRSIHTQELEITYDIELSPVNRNESDTEDGGLIDTRDGGSKVGREEDGDRKRQGDKEGRDGQGGRGKSERGGKGAGRGRGGGTEGGRKRRGNEGGEGVEGEGRDKGEERGIGGRGGRVEGREGEKGGGDIGKGSGKQSDTNEGHDLEVGGALRVQQKEEEKDGVRDNGKTGDYNIGVMQTGTRFADDGGGDGLGEKDFGDFEENGENPSGEGRGRGKWANEVGSSRDTRSRTRSSHLTLPTQENASSVLEGVLQEKAEAENLRQLLFAKARQLHELIAAAKEKRRSYWYASWKEAKKVGNQLEEEQSSLRNDLDSVHRRVIGTMMRREPLVTGVKDEPSRKANFKISVIRLRHEVGDLKRRVEAMNIKVDAEVKLREQAEKEVRQLRTEVSRKKANMAVTQAKAAHHRSMNTLPQDIPTWA